MDEVLDELKAMTGWDAITAGPTAYVVDFHERDQRKISGLARNEHTFYIASEQFRAIPISFRVHFGEAIYQYWTLNKQLHRLGDKPAKIVQIPGTGFVKREWCHGGIHHRDSGPAIDTTYQTGTQHTHPESGDALSVNQTAITWKGREMEFISQGVHGVYPGPSEVRSMSEGYQIVQPQTVTVETRTFDEFHLHHPDQPSLSMAQARITWNPRGNLSPAQCVVSDLREFYDQGVFQKRTALELEFEWLYRGDLRKVKSFDDYVRAELLDDINLLRSPFWATPADEMIASSEFGDHLE